MMRIESLRDLHAQFPDIDGFWEFDNLPQTEATIRTLLPDSPETAPPQAWTPERIEALTQLGRVQGLQGNLSVARATLERAAKLLSEFDGPQRIRPEIRCLLEQGRILCLSMTPAKAQTFLAQAWTLAMESELPFFAIDAALMLSISQPPKYQNEWLQKALALAENSKQDQAQLWLAQLYTMDGWHKFDFRLFDKALESFEKAFSRPRIKGDEHKVFVIRWCLARALRAVGRTQEAFEMQQVLRSETSQTGSDSGHVYLELAECLQALQKHPEAKAFFELAYKELSADGWYSDNKSSELGRIQYLSKKI